MIYRKVRNRFCLFDYWTLKDECHITSWDFLSKFFNPYSSNVLYYSFRNVPRYFSFSNSFCPRVDFNLFIETLRNLLRVKWCIFSSSQKEVILTHSNETYLYSSDYTFGPGTSYEYFTTTTKVWTGCVLTEPSDYDCNESLICSIKKFVGVEPMD